MPRLLRCHVRWKMSALCESREQLELGLSPTNCRAMSVIALAGMLAEDRRLSYPPYRRRFLVDDLRQFYFHHFEEWGKYSML